MTSSAEWLARDHEVLAPVLGRLTDIVAVRGEGSWLIDADGGRWLDFTSGIAVTNVGHCNPRVVAAIQDQAATLIHTSVVTHHPKAVELAEQLGSLVPYFEDPQVFFCNTGAEAVEGALKLARHVTHRPGVIAFRRAFHGRTFGATSLTTAKGWYRRHYEPLLAGIAIAPYAYPLKYGGDEAATSASLAALDEIFDLQSPPEHTGMLIVEPVLGEGGYVVPPRDWLVGLRERCDEYGILLVFDEVQCGMGRTGRPFAAETFDVVPDVILFAKGVADGMPLGGIIAPAETMAHWPTSSHGTTFGGNPISCAAALASLDVMRDGDLYAGAAVKGARAQEVLRKATAQSPHVLEVRGVGLMIGIELDSDDTATRVRARCLDAGLIVLRCGPDSEVIRLIPPLTVADDELEQALGILVDALA